MERAIKDYWNTLKNKYENEYQEPFMKDYDRTKPFFMEFKAFLEERLRKNPRNVDVVCTLASVEMELREEGRAIELLENFVSNNQEDLRAVDRARIDTNLAFYHDGDEKETYYLLNAEKNASPFVWTYKGLALCYFSKYQREKEVLDLKKSIHAFEKGLVLDNRYEMRFGYGVCLFELKQYEKAKELFEKLLIEYPNRMRLILSIAYCEVYLGNKEKALEYLKLVKEGQDENYHLSTDDIGDYQIYDAYYVLEEYELFLKEYENVVYTQFFNEISYYYYALFITKRYQKLDEVLEKDKKQIISSIEETKIDEDFEDEEERTGYIKSYQEDLDMLIKIEHKIKNENYKPIAKLELYPQYGCYLVDCIRHRF